MYFQNLRSNFRWSCISKIDPILIISLVMYFQKIQLSLVMYFQKIQLFAGQVFQKFQFLLVRYFKCSSFCWSGILNVPAFAGHVFQTFQLSLVMYFKRFQHLSLGHAFQKFQLLLVMYFKGSSFCWSCIFKIEDCNSRSRQNLY